MRFLSIYKRAETGTPPTAEQMERMGAFVDEMMRSGAVLATEGCLPSAAGFRVRRDGASVSVTDGPFTEAREVIGGFAILQANSREEALEQARRFLAVAGDGECEVRQLYEAGDADATCVATEPAAAAA